MGSVAERFKDYDKEFTRTSSAIIVPPEIREAIVSRLRGRVLDVGTGDGYKLRNFVAGASPGAVTEIVAIEPSPLYSKAERELAPLGIPFQVIHAAFEELERIEGRFDTILMFEVLEHLLDQRSVMDRLVKLLAPGGTFICSTPNKIIYHLTAALAGKKTDTTHCSELSYRQTAALMRSYYRTVRLQGFFPWMGLFRRFPRLSRINRYLGFLWLTRTVYCFATDPLP